MDLSLSPADPQAAATIAAARITADATIRAALLQAGAAAGAIAAGALAYFGAVRQVRLQERAHEARAVAYRFRLSKVVQEYLAQVEAAWTAARRQFDAQYGQAAVPIISLFTQRPRTLHDDNWEAHALLGRRAVELILVIDDASLRLKQFDAEIKRDSVRTDAHFQFGTLTPGSETAEGPTTYSPTRAIIDYVEVLGQLRRALIDLLKELAKPSEGAPWRRFWRVALQPFTHTRTATAAGRVPTLPRQSASDTGQSTDHKHALRATNAWPIMKKTEEQTAGLELTRFGGHLST
jgi:hypothetical protein